jgi:hypothetical protein
MRKFTRTAAGGAVTGAAFLAAFALGASPAFAAPTGVTVSGSSSTGAVTATASTPTLTDTTTGTKLTCTSSSATATINNGTTTGTPRIKVGTINTVTWNTCKLNSITFSVAASATPWNVNITGVTDGSGNSAGSLTGVVAKLSGLCTATVSGTATGHYANGGHALVIDGGTLTVSGVGGLCLGLINNGDSVTYTANYVVSPALTVVSS